MLPGNRLGQRSLVPFLSGNFFNIMVSGDPVIKEPLTVADARKQAQTWKSSTVCECSGNFLHIIVTFDPVIKEVLTVVVAS